MIAASVAVQRPRDGRLLYLDASGRIRHTARANLASLLRPGDVVVANDAATLPASLQGTHLDSGRTIEIRLAARESLDPLRIARVSAVVFGEGDYRTRTEDRPAPPELEPGARLHFGSLRATVAGLLDHPRLVTIEFDGAPETVWAGLAREGRPIQYAHMAEPLALWDVWTPIAGPPAAFEPPSAGFILSWAMLAGFASRGIRFCTLTHAAGISSTGDPALDLRLPLDEPYRIPASSAAMIDSAHSRGRRVVAIGTSVVRALEHAADDNGVVRSGCGTATQKIGQRTSLRVVDAMVSGTHEPGTSHYELLRAFAPDVTLHAADQELNRRGYRTHEFGDSVLVEKAAARAIRRSTAA